MIKNVMEMQALLLNINCHYLAILAICPKSMTEAKGQGEKIINNNCTYLTRMQAGCVLLVMVTSVRGYLVSPLPRTPGPGPGLHPWAAPTSPVSVLLQPATARVICSACRYHPPPIRPSWQTF